MRAITITIALVWSVGCGAPPHVQLAPIDQLTPSQRVERFHALRPVKEGTSTNNGSTVDKWLVLADKTEVGYPEDLAPVVGEDSATMRAARASKDMRSRTLVASTISTVGILGGFVLGGMVADSVQLGPSPWTALSLFSVGLIAGVFAWHYNDEEMDLRRKAFSTYPRDLGARLNVCAHGLQVVACEAPIE